MNGKWKLNGKLKGKREGTERRVGGRQKEADLEG